VVRTGQFDAQRLGSGSRAKLCTDRAERLGENRRCPAMQEAVRLGVPFDGHPGDQSFRSDLREHDAHAFGEGSRA
jgi:hypothetical protein